MAIEIDGNPNVIDFSLQEDATPVNPADSSSGYGQITYTVLEAPDSTTRGNTTTKLSSTELGAFDGIVLSATSQDGVLSVVANSAIARMGKWLTVTPFQGTVQAYCNKLKALVRLNRNIIAAPAIAGTTVRVPGFYGNVWEGFKDFLSAHQYELVQEDKEFLVRPMRTVMLEPKGVSTGAWTVDTSNTVERIETTWYDTKAWATDVSIFPVLSDTEFEPFSVGANETIEQEVTIDGSITSLKQPVAVDYVGSKPNLSGTSGVYCVSGSDGMPILADRWKASGGWLRVEKTPDPSVIKIIVHGGKVEEYAPYRIAATAGESSYYNSLHILGTGFRWTERQFSMNTGAPASDTEEESFQAVSNRNLVNIRMGYRASLLAARDLSGAKYTENATALQLDDNALGFPLGGRIRKNSTIVRVDSQTVSPTGTVYTAQGDVTISELKTFLGSMTVAQFNSRYNGFRVMDFNMKPFKEV